MKLSENILKSNIFLFFYKKIGYNYIIGKGRSIMILRKPYAFFIKYFKVLHAIIAVLVAVLLYRSFTLYNFFRAYVNDYSSALNDLSPRSLLNMYSFIMVLGVIILIIILLSVMIYKKKPKALYIYSLIVYVFVIILYGVTYPVLRDISASILDIRFSSALRDFFMIAAALQFVSLILYIVRATGFDIKQFDFGTDLQKLDINDKDSEEIEVALEFDQNKLQRQVKYKFRQFKYVYGENKFLINTIGIIVVVVLAFTIYLNLGVYTASYNQGTSFSASGVVANVRDTYLTQTNALGNKLTDDMIVVVKLDVKKNGDIKKTLNTGLATLRIDNVSYSQNSNYAKELYDLGTAYVNQELNNEFQSYILTFVVPEEDANKKMVLKFNDNVSYVKGEVGAKSILVTLNPISLVDNEEANTSKLGEEETFENSVLENATLKIDRYEINDKFKVDYNYCYGTDKCLKSSEYLTPTATGNYLKTLMKIDGEFNMDKNVNSLEISDFYSFLNTFVTINYKVNDKWISQKINTQNVKPTSSTKLSDYYIEVPSDVKNASEIYLTFTIRNYTYRYILK